MKILYLNPLILYPPYMGNQMTGLNRVKVLSLRHEVTLVCFYHDKKQLPLQQAELKRYCHKIFPVYLPKWKSFLNVATGFLFDSKPLQLLYYGSAEMKTLMLRLADEDYDVIHVNTIRMEQFVNPASKASLLIDLHDSMILNVQTRVKREKGLKKFIYATELKRINQYEESVVKNYSYLAVLAEQDKQIHGNNEKIEVIHLGVDTSHFKRIKPLPQNGTMIFSGNMSYTPNIDAVVWFLENCWQQILNSVPNAQFKIVGVSPGKELEKYRTMKGVVITGKVESIPAVMDDAQIAIVPLRIGSGMQNKVLEAMACSLPVICTGTGLGNIRAVNGESVIVADDPEKFTNACIELLINHEKCRAIGEKALQLIKDQYSIEQHCSRLEELYLRIRNRLRQAQPDMAKRIRDKK